jgi:hypothetical protein
MNKFYALIIIVILSFIMIGCAVNSTTGAITVTNISDKDGTNIKVGNVYIGTVAKGSVMTVYFFSSQNDAVINVDGFSPNQSSLKGTIDLKTSYNYGLSLSLSGVKNIYRCTGTPIGTDENSMTIISLK